MTDRFVVLNTLQKLMKEHDVKVVSVTTKYHHNFTAFVERFNKTLAERHFKAPGCSRVTKSHERLKDLGQIPTNDHEEIEQRENEDVGDGPSQGGKTW